MKELERISDYITQLENERAELNKQIDTLKSDIEILSYSVKNICAPQLQDVDFRTKLIKTLAINMQDRVDVLQYEYDDFVSIIDDVTAAIRNNDLRCPDNLDIRDEDKIRSLYEAVGEAIDRSKSVDTNLTTPNDEVTVLRNFIKRLGTAVEWKYANQEEPWTDSQINELIAIVEGNHIARKNLDVMSSEIDSITSEIQNDNFGLYRTFIGVHTALNTYKFDSTRALAETIHKLADTFVQSCAHLETSINNLEATQICCMHAAIAECVDSAHKWRVKSGALRWLDHRH